MDNSKPKIRFVHANRRVTGSMAEFQLVPANGVNGGGIAVSISRQAGTDVPTFGDSVEIRLGIDEIGKVLMVLRGMRESLDDGKGVLIVDGCGRDVVKFSHRIEPVAGYEIQIWHKPNYGEQSDRRFTLTDAEALVLSLAIEESMGIIAFGVHS